MGILRSACIAALLFVLAFGRAYAEEPAYDLEAEGAVTSDTVWSGSVIVYGDVLVPEGVTLTIEPGTVVSFSYTESSKIEPAFLSMETELLIRGKLVCNGTKDAPVVFMPAPEEEDLKAPERGDWGGIIFDGDASSASVISHAKVVMADIGISTFYSSPTVVGTEITGCEYGVYAAGKGGPTLKECVVTGAEFGVVAHGKAAPVILDTEFKANGRNMLVGEDG